MGVCSKVHGFLLEGNLTLDNILESIGILECAHYVVEQVIYIIVACVHDVAEIIKVVLEHLLPRETFSKDIRYILPLIKNLLLGKIRIPHQYHDVSTA